MRILGGDISVVRFAGALLSLFVFFSTFLLAAPQAVASANTHGTVILADAGEGVPSFFQVEMEKAAPFIAYQKAECAKYGWWRIGLYFVLTEALQFLSAWGVSKLLARKQGTLWNTARMFFYGLLTFAGFLVLAYCCVLTKSFLVVFVLLFVLVVVDFVIIMVVYHLGFWRTIGFYLCYGLASMVLPIVPQVALGPLPWNAYFKLRPEERLAIYQEWNIKLHDHDPGAASSSPASAAAPAPGTSPADVRAMYERLQQERAKLDANNPAAVAQFNQHAAEYAALNARLAAAASPAPSALSKKPKATPPGKN